MDDYISKARDLLAAATPGPWEHEAGNPDIEAVEGGVVAIVMPHAYVPTVIRTGQDYSHADAALIAAAPTVIADLLAALDEARGELDGLRFQHINATRAADDAHEAQQRLAGRDPTPADEPWRVLLRCYSQMQLERARYMNTLARATKAEAERDAYKKAKAENDERFMRERDEARGERDALRDEIQRLRLGVG